MDKRKNLEVNKLFPLVVSKNIISSIGKTPNFSDEPNPYSYYAIINDTPSFNEPVVSAGLSFFSHEEAILKCLGESIERYCWYNFKANTERTIPYDKIHNEALDPALINNNKNTRLEILPWVMGNNITKNKPSYIPNQLVHFYTTPSQRTFLHAPNISTGCAGGFDHASTLLRGIYEVIERDSFMNIFLAQINSPKVDLTSIKSEKIDYLLNRFERFKLKINTFNITSDLGIPAFLTILVDSTGIGPAISCGAKCSLNIEEAILGSITESFLTRTWLRESLIKSNYQVKNFNTSLIETVEQRGLYWSKLDNIENLNFLLNQKKHKLTTTKDFKNAKTQLSKIISLLSQKGHEIFYVNIGDGLINDSDYLVYRTIIPTLQPLYLRESEKNHFINGKRLEEVATFFGKKKYDINTQPHPFL